MRSGWFSQTLTGSCAKLPLSVFMHVQYTLQYKSRQETLIGQVVVYFSVNEVYCEVSSFCEKTGGVGCVKDMSRQNV